MSEGNKWMSGNDQFFISVSEGFPEGKKKSVHLYVVLFIHTNDGDKSERMS